MPPAENLRALARAAQGTVKDAFHVWLTLMKVMVPIIVVVKVLTELDLVRYLALPLSPVMGLVGLPADLGLSWATSMLVNIYSGLFVYAGLLPGMEQLTVAQVTTFATMTLIAHNVLVEGRIAQQCGLNMTTQIALRFGGALLCGMLMRAFFDATGYLSEPAVMLWAPREAPATLVAWAWNEARNLVSVLGIVLALMGLMRVLDAVGITRLLNACLRPALRLMGTTAAGSSCTRCRAARCPRATCSVRCRSWACRTRLSRTPCSWPSSARTWAAPCGRGWSSPWWW